MTSRLGLPVSGARRWIVVAVVCIAALVTAIDNLILNSALPTMATDLDASTSELQWIVDAYVLVYAGLLLVGGSLGDRYGRARMQRIGLTIFGTASLLGALSSSTIALILCRGAMGAGAALSAPASLAMLATVFSDAGERRRAFGCWSTASGIGLALGPVLGGALLARFWWGSVFLVNVPTVALALVAGWFVLPESRNPKVDRLDPLGIALSATAIIAVVWATIVAPAHGWTSTASLVSFGAAATLLAAFVTWELRCDHPMLRLDFFRSRRFTAATACAVAVQFANAGTMFCLTQLLQSVYGYSPLAAGLRIVPFAVAFAGGAMCSPRLAERLTPRGVVSLGSVMFAIGLLLLVVADTYGGMSTIFVATVVMGAGAGSTVPATNDATMSSVSASHTGAAAGTLTTVRQISNALGVAVIGSILVSSYQSRLRPVLHRLALSDDERSRSLNSVASALRVSRGLDPLAASARDAFASGMRVGSLVAAALLFATAAMARRSLPADVHRAPRADPAHTEAMT